MYEHNLNPYLTIFGVEVVPFYGLVYFLGFLFLYFFLKHKSTLKPKQVDDYIFYLLIGMLIGARLFAFLYYEIELFLSDPLILFKLWLGGMSFHGGLLGMIVATYYFAKKHSLNFYKLADIIVIPGAIFLFFGRIANFINGELPGTITQSNICVYFQGYEGCRHPYQIYEGLKNLALAGILALISTKTKIKGVLFWTFFYGYMVGRFLLDFIRYEGIQGQVLTIIFVVVSIPFFYKWKNTYMKKNQSH